MIKLLLNLFTSEKSKIAILAIALALGMNFIVTKWDNETYIINDDARHTGIVTDTTANGTAYIEVKAIHETIPEFKAEHDSIYKLYKELKGKNRKLVAALNVKLNASTTFKSIIYTDTNYVTIRDTIKTYLYEVDTFNNGILRLTRTRLLDDNISRYQYSYSPTMSLYDQEFKVGKWKLKHIIKRRPTNHKLNLVTNDSNMVVTDIKYILID